MKNDVEMCGEKSKQTERLSRTLLRQENMFLDGVSRTVLCTTYTRAIVDRARQGQENSTIHIAQNGVTDKSQEHKKKRTGPNNAHGHRSMQP